MVEVNESLALLDGRLNVLFRAPGVPRLCEPDGARAGDHTAAILGMGAQVSVHQVCGLVASPQVEEHPRYLVVPERRVRLRRNLPERPQTFLVSSAIDERDADPAQRIVIRWIERKRLLELSDRLVEQPNV